MSKDKISDFDATAANNTDIGGVNIGENCPMSGLNNAQRQMMAILKAMYAGTSGDVWPIAAGGTGATSAAAALAALGVKKGASVASATSCDIWAGADGDYLHVTGTTTITGLGTAPNTGAERTIVFDDVLTLTHHATSLILPGGANITTAAGDVARVRAETTANMRVVAYVKADGTPVVVPTVPAAKLGGGTVGAVGYSATPYSAGTKSSGTFTPDPANGNFQYATNGGAHTLAPPASDCTMVVQYTNNGSAGAVTTSGFTKVTGSFTTTNGDDFMCYITRCNGFMHLHIQALQ
ncbi:MAG: hypothetical protein J0H39_14000 [Alphaproteobacteria bacterium]|nr:hypothetical protein [Alphaproteobacteria bacterium]